MEEYRCGVEASGRVLCVLFVRRGEQLVESRDAGAEELGGTVSEQDLPTAQQRRDEPRMDER